MSSRLFRDALQAAPCRLCIGRGGYGKIYACEQEHADMKNYLAIDIGASSGRHIVGRVVDGKIALETGVNRI